MTHIEAAIEANRKAGWNATQRELEILDLRKENGSLRTQLAEARKALEDVAARARFELDHPTPLRDTAFSFMLIRLTHTNDEGH